MPTFQVVLHGPDADAQNTLFRKLTEKGFLKSTNTINKVQYAEKRLEKKPNQPFTTLTVASLPHNEHPTTKNTVLSEATNQCVLIPVNLSKPLPASIPNACISIFAPAAKIILVGIGTSSEHISSEVKSLEAYASKHGIDIPVYVNLSDDVGMALLEQGLWAMAPAVADVDFHNSFQHALELLKSNQLLHKQLSLPIQQLESNTPSEYQYLIGQQTLTLVESLLDNSTDKAKAIVEFETNCHQALYGSKTNQLAKIALKAAASIAIGAALAIAVIGIGMACGMACGIWAGPVAFLTAITGGSVAAIGLVSGGVIASAGASGLATIGLFNPFGSHSLQATESSLKAVTTNASC